MISNEDTLLRLIENKNQKYNLHYQNETYALEDVTIVKSQMPLHRPTNRGGVYSVSDKEYKIKGTVHDISLVPAISKMMLGPNAEFLEIPITTNITHDGKPKSITLFTYLTNVMHNSAKIEFNMLIVRIALG